MIGAITSNMGLTLEVLGTLFIAYAALRVHHRVLREHKIDRKVFTTMKIEQFVGWSGVVLVVAGYLLEIGVI
ncbi:MAG: hypothetical protein WD003_00870 [Candidatus Paceibacterota bacterium]